MSRIDATSFAPYPTRKTMDTNQKKKVHPFPFVDLPATPANANPLLERDLEGVIEAAARGDPFAIDLVRPTVLRVARDALVDATQARLVANGVLTSLRRKHGLGRPRPGQAVAWLESVTRYRADAAYRRTSRRRYAEWDPPEEDDGP